MIEPSVHAVLSSRHSIRRFFLIMAAATTFAGLIIVVDQATMHATLVGRAIELVASTLAGDLMAIMIIYAVWISIRPPDERNVQLLPITRGEIAEKAESLLSETSHYLFLGRGGGYFRSVILPRLDEMSQTARRRIRVSVVVPNPVGRNGVYYGRMMSALGEKADDNTLAANVLATAIDLAIKAARNPYLTVELSLSSGLPVVRYDVAQSGLLITRDQPKLPALYCSAGNPFYETFRDAVENEIKQSSPIRWTDHSPSDPSVLNTAKDLDLLFSGFPQVDDQTLARALEILKTPSHRYSR